MKKFFSILMIGVLLFSLVSCGNNGGSSSSNKKIKIGVANIMTGENLTAIENYYNKEVAETLNVEFMISEQLSNDASSLIDFIDKAQAAGCDGIINMVTGGDAVSQGANKCEEYGMWFVTNNSKVTEEVSNLSHNLGHCGADPMGMEDAYKKAFKEICSDGENHSVFMYTCAAPGQTAASHYYSAIGVLKAMEEVYGLKYESSIEDIVNKQEPGEVKHDKMSDIHIYLCPGMDFSNFGQYVTAAQTQFQTGNYDIFAACASWTNFTEAINAVETQKGIDIKIVGTMNIEDQTKSGLEDGTIDAAIVNPLNVANGVLAAMICNGVNGSGEDLKDNGNAVLMGVQPWVCMNEEDYNTIAGLDKEVGKFVLGGNGLKKIIASEESTVSYEDINKILNELSDINNVVSFMEQ